MRKLKKLKYRVMASVYPTPHTNAERIWLSSGRVPLYDITNIMKYKNLVVFEFLPFFVEDIKREVVGNGKESGGE